MAIGAVVWELRAAVVLQVWPGLCHTRLMISVILPTLNSAGTLALALQGLIPAAVHGLVREVILADGGSSDATLRIADGVGADTVAAGPTRASRLIAGAQRAKFPWLLFLNPDAVLDAGWEREAEQFIEKVDGGRLAPSAAVFRFLIDDDGFAPRAVEMATAWSDAILGLAHAEQGLLIPRALYAELGGFAPLPVLEDIDFARRLGRARIVRLKRPLVTNAGRFRSEGYGARSVRHAGCVVLLALNVPLERIAILTGTTATPAAGV